MTNSSVFKFSKVLWNSISSYISLHHFLCWNLLIGWKRKFSLCCGLSVIYLLYLPCNIHLNMIMDIYIYISVSILLIDEFNLLLFIHKSYISSYISWCKRYIYTQQHQKYMYIYMILSFDWNSQYFLHISNELNSLKYIFDLQQLQFKNLI